MKATFILCAALLLAGCGVKPGDVTAPPHLPRDAWPHVYPDPATDPTTDPTTDPAP